MKIRSFYSFIVVGLITACVSPLATTPTNQVPVAYAASATALRTPTRVSNIEKTEAYINTTKEATIATSPTRLVSLYKTSTKEVVAAASATITSYAYIPVITYTPAPVYTGVVADHTVIAQFANIPQSSVNAAAAKKLLFMHQSTGGLIDDSGLGCLAGLHGSDSYYPQECTTYANNRSANTWPWYDKSNWNWEFWPTPEADAIAKTDQFVSMVHSLAGNYEIIGMKYCYVDGWNQSDNVDQQYYIKTMLALESEYPGKTFIWSTSALWNEPGSACGDAFNSCAGISAFNEQVRAYAKAHNKPLFDIADIESHDQNGNSCTVDGYEGMCAAWYDSGGGHPNAAGAIRLAKGFWWLMARINGWSGQ